MVHLIFKKLVSAQKNVQNVYLPIIFNAAAAVAAIIFNDEGKLLFTRRAIQPYKGMLDLLGGFVDHMETAENALCRELNEELGITATELEYFCSSPNEYPFSGLSVFTLDLVFKVKTYSLKKHESNG